MKRFNNGLLAATGLLTLVGAMVITASPSGQAQGKRQAPNAAATTPTEVLVVNTVRQPVPTVAQGTTNVSGSVSVTNTPTVNLASDATIQVGNNEANPVLVRTADDARQPFQQGLDFTIPEGALTRTQGITLPAGKRLVIEHISALLGTPLGQNITHIDIGVTVGTVFARHFVIRQPQGVSEGGTDLFAVSQEMRLYADGLIVSVTRNNTTLSAGGTVTISGYLVDIP